MSLRRTLSSQANGRLSKGPVTPEGKQRSSRNALRHGLLSRCLVLQNESEEGFEHVMNTFLERLQPVDDFEYGLVEEIVAAHWRLRRAWAVETRMLDNDGAAGNPAGDNPFTDPLDNIAAAFRSQASSTTMPLMHRYETRLQFTKRRGIRDFRLMRTLLPAPAGTAEQESSERPFEPSPKNEQ